MFNRLQIVSPFREKSADEEITGARTKLTSRVLRISPNACISPLHTHAAREQQCTWSCRLINGLQNPTSESIGYAKLKKSHKAETAVHGCLLPAKVICCTHAYGSSNTKGPVWAVYTLLFEPIPFALNLRPLIVECLKPQNQSENSIQLKFFQ